MKPSVYILLVAANLLGGCASADLTIQIDIYGGDMRRDVLLDPANIAASADSIDNAKNTGDRIVRMRVEMANVFAQALKKCADLSNAAQGFPLDTAYPGDLAVENRQRVQYVTALTEENKAVARAAKRSQTALAKHIEILKDPKLGAPEIAPQFLASREELHEALAELEQHVVRISGDLGTPYEQHHGPLLDRIKDTLKLEQAKIGEIKPEWKPQVLEIAKNVAKLVGRYDKISQALRDASAASSQSLSSEQQPMDSGSDLNDTLAGALHAAEAIAPPTEGGASAFAVIDQLSQANDFYSSQIDRLQDLADPAWRVISNSNNDYKWHPEFAKTTYHSEGNSEVVIIRDSTGHFRAQYGKNNPTALVQGQLRINRSIASGLLDVLAAGAGVTGVPGLSQVLSKASGEAAPSAPTPKPAPPAAAPAAPAGNGAAGAPAPVKCGDDPAGESDPAATPATANSPDPGPVTTTSPATTTTAPTTAPAQPAIVPPATEPVPGNNPTSPTVTQPAVDHVAAPVAVAAPPASDPGTDKTNTSADKTAKASDATTQLAQIQTKIKASRIVRAGLEKELKLIRAEISKTPKTQPVPADLVRRLISTLNAYKTMLSKPN